MAILPGSFKRKSLIEQLDFMNLVLTNAGSDRLSKYFIPIGYGEEKLNEGRELFNELERLENERSKASHAKKHLRNDRDEAIALLHKRSAIIRRLIKEMYKSEPGIIQELGIHQPRVKPHQVTLWIKQTGQLYRNLTKKMAKPLHVFGIDQERISEDIEMLERIESLENDRIDMSGTAMRATAERNSALKIIQEWISTFITFAQITLESTGSEQLLESMGILVRSKR